MSDLPDCGCGCGKPVKRLGNKYIHNHHTKNKPGRIVPDDEKSKHSEYQQSRWKDPKYRSEAILKIKESHNRIDFKLKQSENSKKQWANSEFMAKQIIAKNRPEARKFNSESQLGNKRSEETGLKLKRIWDNKSKEEQLKIINKRKQTLIKRGQCIPDNLLSNFMIYYKRVRHFTNISSKKKYTRNELNRRKLAGIINGLQLDHKFSITEGFKNNILPCVIGSECNLELIPWLNNIKKHIMCSITKEKLFELYKLEIKGF